MAVEGRMKRWGNSLAVVVPKKTAERLKLGAGDCVFLDIEKKSNPLKELFGSMKFKKSTRRLLKEMREEWEGKWLSGEGV